MKHNNFFLCGNEQNQVFHRSMRHRGLRFGSAAFKSGADDSSDDEEEKKKLLLQVREAAKEEIKNTKIFGEFEDLQKEWAKLPLEAVRKLCDKDDGVLARFAKIDAKFLEYETRMQKQGKKNLTLRGQIEKWHEDNKEVFANLRNRRKVDIPTLELQIREVASPMLPSNTYTGDNPIPVPFYEPGINDIPRPQPTFWDMLTKGQTDQPAYGWVNKTNVQGEAGFVGPGELKPDISFQLEAMISTYKKIAVTDKVAVELLWDIKGMETMIKDEIRYQILIKVNTALLTGTFSSTTPAGITTLAVPFTLTGLETENPNYFDALRAVVAQLRSGYLVGDITIVINPVDSANMDMSKATTSGVYLLPSFVTPNGKNIAGATVVEDSSIPVGSFLAGFLRYYRVLIYKPLFLTFGWENDDFTRNLVTYLGEMALHQFFNEAYTGAFVYDTFENVIGAIGGA